MFVPMMPDGPRLIQPTAYSPITVRVLSGSMMRPCALGITPARWSNGTPDTGSPL
ncbi:MAG: hypothetical protein U0703_02110 [Anaerolineae bacterium]